jgi:Uri superfamily endonuclease
MLPPPPRWAYTGAAVKATNNAITRHMTVAIEPYTHFFMDLLLMARTEQVLSLGLTTVLTLLR